VRYFRLVGSHPWFREGRVFPYTRISATFGEWLDPWGREPEANHAKFGRNRT
jgi:hypothetical protein